MRCSVPSAVASRVEDWRRKVAARTFIVGLRPTLLLRMTVGTVSNQHVTHSELINKFLVDRFLGNPLHCKCSVSKR